MHALDWRAVSGILTGMVRYDKIDINAPVQTYLPEWQGPNKEKVLIRHLLTHSSGLPAWRPLYKETTSPEQAMKLVLETQLDTLPGARMLYSDLNFILLGQIVQRLSGQRLDVYTREHVFGPLKMTDTQFNPDKSLLPRIAPTEVDPWRQRQIRGEVHDENAFVLGGVSGHAGLFSTAADVSRLCQAYLNGGTLDGARIWTPETIKLFTTVYDSTFSNRALGWETPNGVNSAGRVMRRPAFGHTGFTGTSIWIDPANDLFAEASPAATDATNPIDEGQTIIASGALEPDAARSNRSCGSTTRSGTLGGSSRKRSTASATPVVGMANPVSKAMTSRPESVATSVTLAPEVSSCSTSLSP